MDKRLLFQINFTNTNTKAGSRRRNDRYSTLVTFFMTVTMTIILTGFSICNAAEKVTVQPKDNGTDLRNPGMGWVFHHFDNSIDGYGEYLGSNYDGRDFPGLTVAYLRLAWSFLEPKEGEFNWSVLDSVIQRYERVGIRFAFRLTTFEGNDEEDGIPDWFRKAGCPGLIAKPYGRERWEVDYSSELFLKKFEKFLNAVGKRYCDNPNLEFVDIGSLGIWGEGHPVAKSYSVKVLKKHIDLHKKAFPKTWIVANDDMARFFHDEEQVAADLKAGKKRPIKDPDTLKLFLDEGLSIRDDSLNVYPDPKTAYSADIAALFWKKAPVILEMGHYEYAKKIKAWGGERYSQAVSDYRGSYTSIHGNPIQFLNENRQLIHEINLKLGYRFQLVAASWNKSIRLGEKLEIDFTWKNAGVAPSYRDSFPIWTLINEKGDICAVFADESFNMKQLMPQESKRSQTSFWVTPKLRPGKYTVCISVGSVVGTPEIELPLPSCLDKKMFQRDCPSGKSNGSDTRRYPLAEIEILGK